MDENLKSQLENALIAMGNERMAKAVIDAIQQNQNKKIYQAKHCDMVDQLNKPLTNSYTGILNFTTSNGGTKIDKKEYSSKQNEFIYFENNISHAGIVQTDTTIRIVLNINWL